MRKTWGKGLLLVATVVAQQGCVRSMAEQQRYMRQHEMSSDKRCPDGAQEEAIVPTSWVLFGKREQENNPGSHEIVYIKPGGSQTTWCEYTKSVWDHQRAALWRGEQPSHEIYDERRQQLIAREREEIAKHARDEQSERENDQYRLQEAREEYDEGLKRDAVLRAEAARREANAAAEVRKRHDELSGKLAGVLLGRAHPVEVASAQICVQREVIANARQELARQQRIGARSGAIHLREAYAAGEDATDAEDEAAAITALVKRRYKTAPRPCRGGVAVASDCLLGADACEDHETFTEAWAAVSDLLDGADADALESPAREALSSTDDASARATAAAQVLMRRQ